jgi:hypothetical protein
MRWTLLPVGLHLIKKKKKLKKYVRRPGEMARG